LDYDNALKTAEENRTTPPAQEGVDLRTADELQAELANQKAQLELNMITNPGIVEQYEKRKKDVSLSLDDDTLSLTPSYWLI